MVASPNNIAFGLSHWWSFRCCLLVYRSSIAPNVKHDLVLLPAILSRLSGVLSFHLQEVSSILVLKFFSFRMVNKRQRTDAMGAAAVSGAIDYLSLIGSLPAQTLSNILLRAAQQHPDVATSIVNERNKIVVAERSRTIDFDHYSKSAWKVLNVTYSRLRSSQQYEKAFDAASEVQDCIKAIRKATPAHSNFCTKKSALETLRKIGKSISLSGDELGREVRKVFQYEDCLESTMLRIAKRLTMEERNALMTQEFVDKLVELEQLSSGYCIFENLKDVRLVLLGKQESVDEVPEVDEDDEDEEDEENTEGSDEYDD